MAKRFTETSKWTNNKWFFNLSVQSKLFWIYLLDSCDNVGVWEENISLASKIIGYEYSLDTLLKDFEKQVYVFKDSRKWWIRDFCEFQYGNLNEDSTSKPIQSYISALKKHGLWKEYIKGIYTLQEKEKDKDKEKEKDKGESEGGKNNYKFSEFIHDFNSITGKSFKGDNTAKTHFNARIKEGYTREEILKAIQNCLKDPFHEQNPKYLTPEFITRPDKIEKFLNYKPSPDPRNDQSNFDNYDNKPHQ